MKLLLGIVGEQFSGKDTVAEYLERKYGAFHIRQSHILDEILNTLGIEISRRNEMDLGMALRKTFGTQTVGEAVRKRLDAAHEEIKVVQGIRFREEFDIFKAMGAKMLYVTAPAEIRYQRALKRNEKSDDQNQSFEEFTTREVTEPTEINIATLGGQADYRIENDGTLEQLYQKIEQLIHGQD